MGHWGIRSDQTDEADDALDVGFERVHGSVYDDLMDDRNPLSFDEVQRQLANPETLTAAIDALRDEFGPDLEAWPDEARVGFCGVVVRHAEFGVLIPSDLRDRAIAWLEAEDLEWPPQPKRDARRNRELEMLRNLSSS